MGQYKAGMFSAFTLKLFACAFMLCDHIGVIFFPDLVIFRIIGRLAFPLFAYFIAEGCRYTKNKLRRFLSVFILGVLCEIFYVLFSGAYYGNILLTFSVSILLVYLLNTVKSAFSKKSWYAYIMLFAFVSALCVVYAYCEFVGLDYGFFGVLAPVFCVLFDDMGSFTEKLYRKLSRKTVSVFMLMLVLVMLSFSKSSPDYQLWSLLSIPLLLLYNGERGKYSMKYFFYVFYPVHLVLLQGIHFLIYNI